jgi:hypothetical protein
MSASFGATLVYAWGRGRNARSFLLRWCRWATSASDALADPWRAAAPKHRARKLNDVESDTGGIDEAIIIRSQAPGSVRP